jgi:hypothetical protein
MIGMRALKLFSGVVGTFVTLTAIPLLIAGTALFAVAAGGDRTELPTFHVSSNGRALTATDLDFNHGDDWLWMDIGEVRIHASDRDELFVGVGPEEDVRRFLANDGVPGDESFWIVDGEGRDVSVDWNIEDGYWSAVVMNADGSPGVNAEVQVDVPAWPIRLAGSMVVGLGLAMGAFGAGLMWLAWRRTPEEPSTPPVSDDLVEVS